MTMTAMTIELVLATYRGEQYLPQLLESISKQSGAEFQLLCRDDGPAGATAALLRDFAARARFPVRLLPGGERLGAAGNFQKLLAATTADLVFLLDQDDLLEPDKVAVMAQKMTEAETLYGKNTPILLHSDLKVIDQEGALLAKSFWRAQKLDAEQATSFAELLTQNRVTGCACCINRALIDRVLPFETQELVMHDWFLALAAAAFGKVVAAPEPLTRYRLHEANAIGAKPFTVKLLWQSISGGSDALRSRVSQTMRQAHYFHHRFRGELTNENREILEDFLKLPTLSLPQRIALSQRRHFRKYPIIRQLAFWFYSR